MQREYFITTMTFAFQMTRNLVIRVKYAFLVKYKICIFENEQVRLHLNVKLFNGIRMTGFVVRLFCMI